MSRTTITIRNKELEEFTYDTLVLPNDNLTLGCTCGIDNPFAALGICDKFHSRTYVRTPATLIWQESA